ncbi:hypothetical protein CORC01_12889 [Colletotrichum orchidophilum]|uniref:Uncharacterized protein n=1 Tax=Colletotrichum orchidophilum TaxID=1209926 RepID=A0A1G4ARS4_9PEZI|nr:uncharacterized protein CORC01_12889 [Colletotrichum orchidophilum]OHE91815.1 hypothetical protein CORC01_12889 [Colletotrichum orchidophilum]
MAEDRNKWLTATNSLIVELPVKFEPFSAAQTAVLDELGSRAVGKVLRLRECGISPLRSGSVWEGFWPSPSMLLIWIFLPARGSLEWSRWFAGADMNAVNNIGDTGLYQALSDAPASVNSAASSAELVRLMLESVVDFKAVDDDGATPLHPEASYGNNDVEIALHLMAGIPSVPYLGLGQESVKKSRLLVDAGAYVNARTSSGQTALGQARECNRGAVGEVLLQ